MEAAKEIIKTMLDSPLFAAIIGFLASILTQYLIRKQINKHELKKFQLEYKKENLEKLKIMSEDLIKQIYAYDELANHIVVTLNYNLHDANQLKEITSKLKTLNEKISPKLQIHFHKITNIQNEYSMAINKLNNSFFEGLKYEGTNINPKGYSAEDRGRLSDEYRDSQKKKHKLITALINFLVLLSKGCYNNFSVHQ